MLNKSPLRHVLAAAIQSKGAAAAAKDALTHLHADTREFVLHLDLDVIAPDELPAVNVPGSGGLRFDEVRAALNEFVSHKNLLGLDVAQFNPDKDPDGAGARKIVDLLVEALTARLHLASSTEAATSGASSAHDAAAPAPAFEPAATKLPASDPPASAPEADTEASIDERHPDQPAAAELAAPDSAAAAPDAPEPVSVDPSVTDPEASMSPSGDSAGGESDAIANPDGDSASRRRSCGSAGERPRRHFVRNLSSSI